jgi:hypothetical protein
VDGRREERRASEVKSVVLSAESRKVYERYGFKWIG